MSACSGLYAAQTADEVIDEEIVGVADEPSRETMVSPGVETDWLASFDAAVSRDGEQKSVQPFKPNGSHKGLDFSANVGTLIFTKGGSGAFVPEIGLGKRFNKSFYAGIGAGAEIPYSSGSDAYAQLTADFNAYVPLTNSQIMPGGMFRIGYMGDFKDVKYLMLSFMPTVQIPLSNKVDFNFGLGYSHFIYTGEGGGGYGAFTIRAGFDFHKSVAKHKRPPVDTRDSGMQMTLEGFDMFGPYGGGALTFTYKYDPHWSFGIGASYAFYGDQGPEDFDLGSEGSLKTNDYVQYYSAFCHHTYETKVYLRGTYRVFDTKLSPIASCDLGMLFRNQSGGYLYDCTYDENLERDNSFFVSPAIGVSLRTTNNSYLELKVGYQLASALNKTGENERRVGYAGFGTEMVVDKITGCRPFVSFGYTHTFGWGQHWFGK